ncbi:MAG: DUF6488 family protein [Bdellovibrionales bacterium]
MKSLLILALTVYSSVSFAGPGHSHGHAHEDGKTHTHDAPALTEQSAQEAGALHVKRLVKIGKIDGSWVDATFDKAEKKGTGKKTEWLVTFNNEKGEKGKKLFIFLKPNGDFVAANFTGK